MRSFPKQAGRGAYRQVCLFCSHFTLMSINFCPQIDPNEIFIGFSGKNGMSARGAGANLAEYLADRFVRRSPGSSNSPRVATRTTDAANPSPERGTGLRACRSPLQGGELKNRECLHGWCRPWSSKPAGGLNKALSGFDFHTLPLLHLNEVPGSKQKSVDPMRLQLG